MEREDENFIKNVVPEDLKNVFQPKHVLYHLMVYECEYQLTTYW